jgi:hypothetical protein
MGNESAVARSICETCPVRLPCLSVALREETGINRNLMYGTRGGLSAVDRYLVLKAERRRAA